MAHLETPLLYKRMSKKCNASSFEDEHWDVYGVNDALQHNLLADGVDLFSMTTTSSKSQSKSQSQLIWGAQPTSTGWPSSSIISSRASTNPGPISVPPEVNTWTNTVCNDHCNIFFDVPGQLQQAGSSTPSPSQKRGLPLPLARPATDIKRKKTTTCLPTSRASPTLPRNLSGSADSSISSLFPCPFHQHNPAKYSTQQWRSCMGPGWNISRLKEHIYRRHCLSEHRHVCHRCQADFESQSELVHHQQGDACPKLSEPASGKIGKLKKGLIRERRTNMPDAEKWTAIYRILFDCDPTTDSIPGTQSSQPSQRTESPETIADFEHYLQSKKYHGNDERSNEQVQTCLDLIQEWRKQQLAAHQPQVFQYPATAPGSGLALAENSAPRNEGESLAGVSYENFISQPWGFEATNEDWSFLDELPDTFNVTNEWLFDAFPWQSPGDI